MTNQILEERVEVEIDESLYWKINSTCSGRVYETFRTLPELYTGARILDWGCSIGKTTEELQELYPNAEVIGIDVNSANISRAINSKRKGKFFIADGYNLRGSVGFRDESFDLVLCMNNLALDCVGKKLEDKDYAEVLSRITRLVKPDGYLLVSAIHDYVTFKRTDNGFSLEDSQLVGYFIDNIKNVTRTVANLCRIAYLIAGRYPEIIYRDLNSDKDYSLPNKNIELCCEGGLKKKLIRTLEPSSFDDFDSKYVKIKFGYLSKKDTSIIKPKRREENETK